MLGTGLFDFDKAHEHPLWFKELNGFRDHVPETEEYGIRSFVYRARQPFAPSRLQAFLNRPWPGVIRAKGFFWLATRPDLVGEIHQAGPLVRVEKRGLWWSSVPRSAVARRSGVAGLDLSRFDPDWGDRRQEIVFIGCDPMSEAAIRRDLDDCLVPQEHFTPEIWRGMPDPFPRWTAGRA